MLTENIGVTIKGKQHTCGKNVQNANKTTQNRNLKAFINFQALENGSKQLMKTTKVLRIFSIFFECLFDEGSHTWSMLKFSLSHKLINTQLNIGFNHSLIKVSLYFISRAIWLPIKTGRNKAKEFNYQSTIYLIMRLTSIWRARSCYRLRSGKDLPLYWNSTSTDCNVFLKIFILCPQAWENV